MTEPCDSEPIEDTTTIQNPNGNTEDDLFLVSAGFEDRSLEVANMLSSEYSADWGVVYVNSEFLSFPTEEKTKENLRKLQSILSEHCDNVDVIKGGWLEAKEQLQSLRSGLEMFEGRSGLDISIDVTSFNRESLFVALNILYSLNNDVSTRIFYVSPNEYGDWLSKGHRLVRNIIGFGGFQESNRQTLLIILTGFEEDRTLNTIEEIEPAKVLAGKGNPATQPSFLEKNEQEQQKVFSRQDTGIFEFPANDIGGTYEKLVEILDQYTPEYNIVLSPMSTKLSTLGVWKAARKFPECQVTYTIPVKYNLQGYSSGSETLYTCWLE